MICYMNFQANPSLCPAIPRSPVRGFTLIEVMVTLTVAAILASVVVPGFASVSRRFRLNSVSTSLASSLHWARGEAIKANVDVIVCASNSAGTNCANSTNWGANGWIVCYDANADNSCDASTAQLINPLQVYQGVASGVALVTGPAAPVRFTPSGEQPTGAAMAMLTTSGAWSGAPTLTTTVSLSGVVKGSRL